jgi:peptidoglycan hydrolase CwlO-like protein
MNIELIAIIFGSIPAFTALIVAVLTYVRSAKKDEFKVLQDTIKEIRDENKRLGEKILGMEEEIRNLHFIVDEQDNKIKILEEENKKLKDIIKDQNVKIKEQDDKIKVLEEENLRMSKELERFGHPFKK